MARLLVTFEIDGFLLEKCRQETSDPPKRATYTRFYDGNLTLGFEPEIREAQISPAPLVQALISFTKSARRLKSSTPEEEATIQAIRTDLAVWGASWSTKVEEITDLKQHVELIKSLCAEAETKSSPISADIVEALQQETKPILVEVQREPLHTRLSKLIRPELPVFIYFENYGVLDSALYLPRLLEDIKQQPNSARVRTVLAMFKHVNLSPQEVDVLGRESAEAARAAGQAVTPEMIAKDQQQKELRSVKLNAASLDISKRFSDWWQQRRHEILYEADGAYFRIWISDDRRPGVKIELESRSKGFQWFFSFYLIFLVESDDGHRNAILLLDEPGLNLHPTAQQELISFFEKLSEKNQILYSTHSPFLIDGQHIHRVRPVTEDASGHSHISVGEWPKDRDTIFPLQAAAGYAMLQSLFRHKKNVLVEGMSDYYYLHALSLQCAKLGRTCLPDDVYVTPCGGTKNVGHIASLFLGQQVRPVVLLDGDEAGLARRNSLQKELYSGNEKSVLMLSDVLNQKECEVEDILGEATILSGVHKVISKDIALDADDRKHGSLPDQIKAAAARREIELPDGWKAMVAEHLVSEWAQQISKVPEDALARSESLFSALKQRFST